MKMDALWQNARGLFRASHGSAAVGLELMSNEELDRWLKANTYLDGRPPQAEHEIATLRPRRSRNTVAR